MGKGGKKGGSGGGGGKRDELFEAIDGDDDSAVAALLDADPARLEQRNSDGWTPLIAAAYGGSADLVTALLARGASVAAVCKDGDGAVHYAAAQGHAPVLKLLAKAGAKLETADNDGETPADVAQSKKIRTLIEQLVAEADARAGAGGDDDEDGAGEEDD